MATTTASSSSELHQPNNTTTSSSSSTTSISNTSSRPSLVRPHIVTNGLGRNRIVDTIHNNKNSLAQEVIYEVESSSTTSPMTTVSIPSPNFRQSAFLKKDIFFLFLGQSDYFSEVKFTCEVTTTATTTSRFKYRGL